MQRQDIITVPITERVVWIVRECFELSTKLSPETVTDERLTHLLLAMQSCRSENGRNGKINLIPDFSLLDNHYVAWRSALDHIAAKALWLRPGTKESMAQLAESLPSFLIRGKYKFTYDCFSPRILQWRNSLAHFVAAPDLRFLEIGSFEGHSACWLLDNILTHSSSHLVCIDTFKSERAESHFDMNISLTGASHRVTKRIGPSEDELVKLEKNSFDFIYVDGSHEQVSVLQDEVLAWRLLKIGGIMILDDYEMSKDPIAKFLYSNEHPDVGIDAFLDVFKDKYNLIHKGYQVIIQKL